MNSLTNLQVTHEKTNRACLVHFKSILMAFCTYVTEMGRSLWVQIQLAVTPGPHHTDYLTYKPLPCPPPPNPPPSWHCWLCNMKKYLVTMVTVTEECTLYQIARECCKKKKTGTISEPVTRWRVFQLLEVFPPPDQPHHQLWKNKRTHLLHFGAHSYCFDSTFPGRYGS